ncbi:unnamed protein product [Menidia menidia]|uniref:(Atlantic silverside) hypothetical protein n=1 Tax=Menidia menidia TaxID=238744 RepID=A0A8S4AJI1_9TELE|nr:unnamed protein product [Menidia menidia]
MRLSNDQLGDFHPPRELMLFTVMEEEEEEEREGGRRGAVLCVICCSQAPDRAREKKTSSSISYSSSIMETFSAGLTSAWQQEDKKEVNSRP